MTQAETPMLNARLSELIEEFEIFDDWEDRYKYIIDIGKDMPPLSEAEKTEATRVLGCASRVWLVRDETEPGRLRFRGESDAFIVRGLIAVLSRLLNDLPVSEVQAFSIRDTLTQLGLGEALSSQRTNGLISMVERLKTQA